jgi:hypothetical protein
MVEVDDPSGDAVGAAICKRRRLLISKRIEIHSTTKLGEGSKTEWRNGRENTAEESSYRRVDTGGTDVFCLE